VDDPQKPKGSLKHLKRPPITVDPQMLKYAHGKYKAPEPDVPVGLQGTLGFVSWIGAVGIVGSICFGIERHQ
jgi:hypothetical protein